MIASRLGLAIASAIAVVLALIVVLAPGRDDRPIDRALLPGIAVDDITELAWTSPSAPRTTIRRDPTSPTGWSWVDPPGTADARTIGDVLAAVRGARWHRRVPVADAGGPWTTVLAITRGEGRGKERVEIAIGGSRSDAEQAWIAIGPHAYLVDAWVARALAPDRLELRIRRPLADATAAIERWTYASSDPPREVSIDGVPRRLVSPAPLVLAPEVVAALERAQDELEVTRLPSGPVAAERGLRITMLPSKTYVVEAGPCPGDPTKIAIDGTHGLGCVDRPAWDALEIAVDALARPPAEIVERRPVPFEPVTIVLADGTTLDLAKRPRIGDRDADPTRVAELLAVLAAPARPVPSDARVTGQITVTGRHGASIVLELLAGGLLRRRGEPVALEAGAGAWAILTRPASALRDPTLWTEEPTTIRSITIDGTTFTRGAVLGEWTRTGPGRDAPEAVDTLARALAAPRGQSGPPTRPRHTITVEVAPPGRAPQTHTLQIGGRVATGCAAIVEDKPVVIAAEICELAARLVTP